MSLCPVILAGGGGTRLWPLSRAHYPKQFLSLFGNNSMLQETLLRLDGLDPDIPQLDPVLVCNEVHRFLVADQAKEINKSLRSIILEPEGRNTAPALTVVAQALMSQEEDAVMVMMPADHIIVDIPRFQQAIKAGYQMAEQGFLITFGIKPQHAETGYGYIQCGEPINEQSGISKIEGFKEKPDARLAQEYLDSGNYLWNSGIFMMKASVWCREIKRFQPDIYSACLAAYEKGQEDNEFYRLDEESFIGCASDSIDYAVMEKLTNEPDVLTAVVSLDAGWSDIGAWSAVWELGEQDKDGNVIAGDVIQEGTSNSLLKSEHRLVATLGCDNLVVVETADVVLVASKDRAQEVKAIISQLEAKQREERLTHRRVFRPWGCYETVDSGEKFQVKRITVNPGKKLSLQLHHQRAEHWVVVKGTATVTKGEEVFQLKENESTYIPVEVKHRLENATDQALEIIEVQSGSYLGEDDIERFEDDFGRE
ncbi:MAG: mannose-1-phosphate guanylyltransferase/mannose-6-phosphate isomerase [Gammaproteobacteria bacterium]|nr:MAG: mannose-1-phosphate guanylyltransferase/mannose-6-phosphate isomerase [Gammaproteobacteria bacterium]